MHWSNSSRGHKVEERFGFKKRKGKGKLIAISIYLEGWHGKFTFSNGQMPTHLLGETQWPVSPPLYNRLGEKEWKGSRIEIKTGTSLTNYHQMEESKVNNCQIKKDWRSLKQKKNSHIILTHPYPPLFSPGLLSLIHLSLPYLFPSVVNEWLRLL